MTFMDLDKMSTRGFIGIRDENKLIDGRFNHWDSYYNWLGKKVIKKYFDGNGSSILELADNQDQDLEFLYDGLFCEFAYVYNVSNDTLEVYRGFFKKRQVFNVKEALVNALEDKKEYYPHLILIIDKKKMDIKKVKKAFKLYEDSHKIVENWNKEEELYPEHKVIKLNIPEGYVALV